MMDMILVVAAWLQCAVCRPTYILSLLISVFDVYINSKNLANLSTNVVRLSSFKQQFVCQRQILCKSEIPKE